MKKQIFLLTNLLLAGSYVTADNACCTTTCSTATCNTGCNKGDCLPTHGQTYRRTDPEWANGMPLFVSSAMTDEIRALQNDDKKGFVEVAVYGGQNTKRQDSAKYYFPYGYSEYTFDGSIQNTQTLSRNLAWSEVRADAEAAVTVNAEGTGYDVVPDTAVVNADAATYKFDANADKSKLLPWNFGITYAALFEPLGAEADGALAGTGLITNPTFKSTIAPQYRWSHVGAGFALRYHFSDDKEGFFARISTAVENVKSQVCLNETVVTAKKELTDTNFPPQLGACGSQGTAQIISDNPYGLTADEITAGTPTLPFVVAGPTDDVYKSSETPTGSINAAYINCDKGTGFPTEQTGLTTQGTPAPANVSEAFMQAAWLYGKAGCKQSITRLADIELLFGYQWLCSDCASNNWYLGVVIPTGNKPCANFMAPAVVGNGQHAGLMVGSSLELLLSETECRAVWYRLDTNSRYLFRNTQKRSFDLLGNEWSRYMMVWPSKDAYTSALTAAVADADVIQPQRNYTPGINVFTRDMKVTPGFQIRLNQAVYFQSEKFRAELGWNLFGRAKECVKFACAWDEAPAFADSSYVSGLGLNNNRTIYNDAQGMVANASARVDTQMNLNYQNISTAGAALYDSFAITEAQVNLDSAATPAAVIQTPYASLGYVWGCGECKPIVSVGAQYQFSSGNRTLNHWMVWGKFELAF